MNSAKSYRILIVDDQEFNRILLGKFLKKEGYEVLEADNGDDCISIAREKDPALILLDIRMPMEDGYSVIKRLKEHSSVKNIPVIFMTALDETKMKVHGFNLGAVDYIVKTCPHEEIIARVKVHIKQYAMYKALAQTQIDMQKQISEAQDTLLIKPQELPDRHFAVLFRSLNAAGGDFYDVIPITDDITGYFICDFAGHSTATGFLTSQMKTLLKQNCIAAFEPIESMLIMNHVLKDTLRPGQYATACYAVVDRFKKTMTIVNMAHPPALFVPAEGESRFIAPQGDILGGFHDVSFTTETVAIGRGDRLIMYTDGLVEKSEERVWASEIEQLTGLVPSIKKTELTQVPSLLFNSFFSQKAVPDDDVLILTFEIPCDEIEDALYTKVFPAEVKLIDSIVEHCSHYVMGKDYDIDSYGLNVVLFEILANAVVHGNKKAPGKKVSISVTCKQEVFSITVIDEGPGFDWKNHINTVSLDSTEGRGLILLEKYGYEYQYNSSGNAITVTKKAQKKR